MSTNAIALMMGSDNASLLFFNFSINFEHGGKWKHAIFRVDINKAVLQLVYKEKLKYEISLEELQTSAAQTGVALYSSPADDVCGLSLPVPQGRFPSLETYSTVDRTMIKELLDTFASEGSLEHLKDAYPRSALHHGVLKKAGKYAWSERQCIVVKWKFFVFRSWHTTEPLQSICLIGMQDKILRKGKKEIEIVTPHKTFAFQAMSETHREEWYFALMVASSMELKPNAAFGTHDPLADADEAYRLALSGEAPVGDDIRQVGKRTRRKGKKTAKEIEDEIEQAQAVALRMMRGLGGSRGNYDLGATDDDAHADALRVVRRAGKGRRFFEMDASDFEREQVSITVVVPHTVSQISNAMAGFTEVTGLFLAVDPEDITVHGLDEREDGTAVSVCVRLPEVDDIVDVGEVLSSIIENKAFADSLTEIYSAVPLLDFKADSSAGSIDLVLDVPQPNFLATEREFASAVTAATAGVPVTTAAQTGPVEFGDCTTVQVTAHTPGRVVEEAASDGRLAAAVNKAATTMGWGVSWDGTVDLLGDDRVAFCTEIDQNSQVVGCIVPALLSCTGITAEITDVLAGADFDTIILCKLGPNADAAPTGKPTVVYSHDLDAAQPLTAALNCPSYASRLATVIHVYESRCRAGSTGTRSAEHGISDFQALIKRIRDNDPTLTVVAVRRQLSPHSLNEIFSAMVENTEVLELDLRGQSGCADLGVGEGLKGLLIANEALQELNLAGAGLGSSGIALLSSGWSLNENLTDVSLAGNDCGDEGVHALVQALVGNTLIEDVNLADNKISSAGAATLAQVFRTSNVRLVLTGNAIDDAGASAIAEAIKANAAGGSTIKLAFNMIGPDGACDLFDAAGARTVHVLDLAHNRIGESGAWALASWIKSGGNVEQVNISGNLITDAGNAYVMESLETNTSVRYINIAANGITNSGAGAFASMLERNSTIEHIDMSNNLLGDAGVILLAPAFRANTSLTRINLGYNEFGPAGARAAADALAGNRTIRRLDVSGNDLCDEGIFCLAESLTARISVSGIKEVEINDCSLTSSAAQSLAQLIQKQGVQNLDLGNNPSFGDTGAVALAQGIPSSNPIVYVNVYLAGLSAEGVNSLKALSNVVVLETPTHDARSVGSGLKKYRALYPHEPDPSAAGCISFAAGDIIIGVESASSDEWLRGYVENRGSESSAGYFPKAFVALLPSSDTKALRKAYGGTTTLQWGTAGRNHRHADDEAFMRSYLSDERRRARLEQLGQLEQRHARRAVAYASVNQPDSSGGSFLPDLSTFGADRMVAISELESSRAAQKVGRNSGASSGGMLALLAYWRQVESKEERPPPAKPQSSSIVRTASQAEHGRRVMAVQELHDEIGTQRRLDAELERVQDEVARVRASLV